MAKQRKSNSNLVLNKGERQLADGRFRFRYTDNDGVQHDVYSWTLRPQDKPPVGRKPGVSLREQEQKILEELSKGVKTWKGGVTLNSLIEEYLQKQKPFWAISTWNVYNFNYSKHIKPKFGKKKVSKLTPDDITTYYTELLHRNDNPLKLATIAGVDRVISPALQMAVRQKIILVNPATGCFGELKKKNAECKPDQRHAMEEEQLKRFLEFVAENHPEYYNFLYVLAWTGCRINELAALSWCDLDFKREVIYIRRSLSYQPDENGRYCHILKEPKTSAGIREIPMLADVKQILKGMQSNCKVVSLEAPVAVDTNDLSMFVFKSTRGNLLTIGGVDLIIHRIVSEYNMSHAENDALPDISAHILRHTFCCWLCEHMDGGADSLKYIQSIMGHANIQITMNVYAECRKASHESRHEQLKRIAAQ